MVVQEARWLVSCVISCGGLDCLLYEYGDDEFRKCPIGSVDALYNRCARHFFDDPHILLETQRWLPTEIGKMEPLIPMRSLRGHQRALELPVIFDGYYWGDQVSLTRVSRSGQPNPGPYQYRDVRGRSSVRLQLKSDVDLA